MELKPGYKQTEMGVIPEDWDVQFLQNLSIKVMVGIASAATHAYRNSGVPMFRNQNIKEGWLDDSDLRFLDPAFDETFQGKRLCGGDLLTARTGYPGTTAVVPPEYTGAQSFTSLIIRPNTSKISSSFLCLYINSPAGKAFFEQSQIGGAQKNVNANTLKRMPVAFPGCKEEQEAIASAVAEIDALTSSLEALISKKRGIKQAAMQELLTGKRRLPGFEGEWEVKRLGSEIRHLQAGVSVTSTTDNEQANTDHYVLKTSAVFQGRFMPAEKKQISPGEVKRAKTSIRKGDLIISRMNTPALVGECGYSDSDHPNLFLPDRLWRADCRDPRVVSSRWLTYALSMQQNRLRIKNLATGTSGSMKNISKHSLLDLEIEWPSFTEQVALAAVLSEMDNEIDLINEQLQKANSIKQGMMQQLLTGKIRLR